MEINPMSSKVPPAQLKKSIRLTKIIAGLKKGKTAYEIGITCGCTEKTIDRDIASWKDNGGFDKWLLSEFLRLHEKEVSKEEGGQSYRVTADLLKKRLKEQQEITATTKNLTIIRMWKPNDPETTGDNPEILPVLKTKSLPQ